MDHGFQAAARGAPGDDYSFGPRYGDAVDVTLTFSNIIFTLVPSCLFVVAALVHLRGYYRRPTVAVRSEILWAKMATAGCILGFSIASSVVWCTNSEARNIPTSIPTAVMFSIAAAALSILVWVEHSKALQPSFAVSFYLSTAMLLDAARARSFTMRSASGMQTAGALTGAVAALKFAAVVLLEFPVRRIPEIESRNLTEELTCGFWNRSVIGWINPLLLIGFRRNLRMGDLKSLDERYSAQYLDHEFTEIWDKEPKKERALAKAFARQFGAELIMACVPQAAYVAFDLSTVYIMQAILTYLADPESSESFTPGGLAAATAFGYLGLMVTKNAKTLIANQVAIKTRSTLFAQVTKKIMRLPLTKADKSTALTHISADAEGISDAMNRVPGAIVAPLYLGAAVYSLYRMVGKVVVLIIPPCFLYIAANAIMTHYIPRTQKRWNGGIDDRVKASTSVLAQLRAIKIVGLAPSAGKYLQSMREAEVELSARRRLCSVISWGYTPFQLIGTPLCVVAGVMFWTGQQAVLDAAVIYPIFSFAWIVVEALTDNRQSWPLIASMFACFSRIQDFLLQDERGDTRQFQPSNSGYSEKAIEKPADQSALSVVDVAVAGKDDGSYNVLSRISLNVERSSLTLLVGPVGSGKSVFLKTLLGETAVSSGTIQINMGSVAYCGQSPWIPRGTVRDVILGESPFEELWYNTVVKACALDYDFARLPENDMSPTGSSGSSLSGGQIRRLGLARAVYSKAQLLLCDDVLSALDKTTSAHIFKEVFSSTGILRKQSRTTILATHSIEWLDHADQIFLFQAGSAKLCDRSEITANIEQMILAREAEREDICEPETALSDDEAVRKPWEAPKMTTDWNIYRFFLGPVPWYFLWPSIVGILLIGFMERTPDLWLRIWLAVDPANQRFFIGLPIFLVMDFVVVGVSLYVYMLHAIKITTKAVHRVFVEKVMSATLPFITSTNNGALLNKFTQDMTLIAQKMPSELANSIYCFELVFQHTVMIAAGAQYAALMIPMVLVVIYYLQLFYLQSSRQMRLLDLESQTPLYTKITESTAGLDHIRAFGWEQKILDKIFADTDEMAKPFHYMYTIQRWLMLVLNGLALAMSVVLVSMAVFFPKTATQAGLGLALISIINYGATVEALVFYWTGLETSLGAIRRIKEFVEDTPTEEDKPGATAPAPSWPSRGRVVLKDVCCAYSSAEDATLALQDINLTVEPGQKAIIVGRTGSGKSTLLLTLLNCLHHTGTVSIDDTDITDITHDGLRDAITTISQEVISFPGTVKDNLVSGNSTDDIDVQEIWSVLAQVRLGDHITKHGGLEAQHSDVHFSVGQKQLFGLARAILHQRRTKGKLVLMDEATSSIDYETDEIIQGVLDTVFADCTRIIISHRQSNTAHYDIVASLENGKLVAVETWAERNTVAAAQGST